MKNVAIIYCPVRIAFRSSGKRWDKITRALQEHNVKYDMIQSESSEGIERLFNMLLDNGYTDIIIAGGDTALHTVVNRLMQLPVQQRNSIRIGVIPNGSANDFASFWGFTYQNINLAVKSIANRRIRKVDVGRITYIDGNNNSKQQYFLNCVNVGLLATIQNTRYNLRRKLFSRKISFAISLIFMLFHKMSYKLRYTINHVTEQHHVTTLCIGNARGYGQTPNAVPYNGLLDVTIVRRSPLTQLLSGMALFLRGKILNHKHVRPYRAKSINIETSKKTPLSIDGLPIADHAECYKIDVLQEQINFIIESNDNH